MSERQKRTQDSAAKSGDSDAEDERGSLANPEPTSGVVERATGLPAREPMRERRTTPQVQPESWDQRDTPEFDLWADRTESVSLLSPEEADRYADRIRPAWEDPDWATARGARSSVGASPKRELTGSQARAALEMARALTPEEADHYAARIRPAWQSAPPPRPLFSTDVDAPLEMDAELAAGERASLGDSSEGREVDRSWQMRTRARQLRGWLIAGGSIACFALFGVLAIAVPGTRTTELPETERAGLSAANLANDVSPVQPERARPGPAPAPVRASTPVPAAPPGEPVPPAPPSEVPNAAAVPAAMPGTVPAPEAEQQATIRIRISAEPARARIRLDGTRVDNPFDMRLPAGVRRRAVIAARGYEERDYTISGDHDERIRVTLVKRP